MTRTISLIRLPVRGLRSGTTHLCDVPSDFSWRVDAFVTAYASPVGPLVALCSVTLKGNLVHMAKMGTATTDPRGCPTCIRIANRDGREVTGAPTAAQLMELLA